MSAPDPDSASIVAIFNPRIHAWSKHFGVDQRVGKLLGTSAIGRATIDRLSMNSPAQIAARQQWLRLNVFLLD